MTVEERVQRGALFLDEHKPGWWRCINTNAFNMSRSCTCILGQLYGSYNNAIHTFTGKHPWENFDPEDDWPFDHGFIHRGGETPDARQLYYQRLEQTWFDFIMDRRVEREERADQQLVHA